MNQGLNDIAAQLSNARVVGDGSVRIQRVHTDTRSLQAGDLFVAIAGDKFDANDMLAQAKASGAAAAIAHARSGGGLSDVGLSGIEVPNTRIALGEIAHAWRKRFNGPLVAVTGSNGKTTVTQMVASILRAHAGDSAHATRNSFNNDIGLPLTLLGLSDATTHAVVEIGMNHPGEIASLAKLAEPTVSLVNNAQREHQEFMGTVEAVARENASVFACTRPGGVALFPCNDAFSPLWRELAQQQGLAILEFGPGATVEAQATWTPQGFAVTLRTPQGEAQALLRMPGAHNIHNALAAAACAHAAGVPLQTIVRGLSSFSAVTGRSRLVALQGKLQGLTLIDDSYNANPDSVRAAVDVLSSLPAPRTLVLGDMGEVGSNGPAFHAEVGAYAAERGVQALHTTGVLAAHAQQAFASAGGLQSQHWDDTAKLMTAWPQHCPASGSLLIKGSRFMKMERLVQATEGLQKL